jgi:hypothetical protein
VLGADAEWTEVHSSEAGPPESAAAGDPHASAIEPVHIEAAAEDLEVVSATQQQLHLGEEEAAGDACELSHRDVVIFASSRFVNCNRFLQDEPSPLMHGTVICVPVRGAWT